MQHCRSIGMGPFVPTSERPQWSCCEGCSRTGILSLCFLQPMFFMLATMSGSSTFYSFSTPNSWYPLLFSVSDTLFVGDCFSFIPYHFSVVADSCFSRQWVLYGPDTLFFSGFLIWRNLLVYRRLNTYKRHVVQQTQWICWPISMNLLSKFNEIADQTHWNCIVINVTQHHRERHSTSSRTSFSMAANVM